MAIGERHPRREFEQQCYEALPPEIRAHLERCTAAAGDVARAAHQRIDQLLYQAMGGNRTTPTRGAPWLNAAISSAWVSGLRAPDRMPCAALLAIATGQVEAREIPARDGSFRGTPRGKRSLAESLAFFSQKYFGPQHHP